MHRIGLLAGVIAALPGVGKAEERQVFLESAGGERIEIASLSIADDGTYTTDLAPVFTEHFLSMRPFKCLEGPQKHWCHVPYPYEIRRDLSEDLTDLEYDFLFLWKGATEYGINMWNGVYYQIEAQADGSMVGVLYDMDMDDLSVPPPAGELRPIREADLYEGDPDSHWLPRLVIE